MENENKSITLTPEEFREVASDVAAETMTMCPHPIFPIISALMFAEIERRLFGQEELTIEGKEDEENG